jgi:hypothetical protein
MKLFRTKTSPIGVCPYPAFGTCWEDKELGNKQLFGLEVLQLGVAEIGSNGLD